MRARRAGHGRARQPGRTPQGASAVRRRDVAGRTPPRVRSSNGVRPLAVPTTRRQEERTGWTNRYRSPAPGAPATTSDTVASSRSPPIAASPSTRAPRCATSPSPTRRAAGSNDDASNAVLMCHAWTGDSHVTGPAGRGHLTPGWWDGMVGPGLAIDTDRWFVVCPNVLGGCQGSTGPASPHPGRRAAVRVTVPGDHDPRHGARPGPPRRSPRHRRVAHRDRRLDGRDAGARVGDHLSRPGAARSCRSPRACRRPRSRSPGVRSGGGPSPSTRSWRGGDYYDAAPGDGPTEGLSIARMVAQVTFRSDNVFTDRFGRNLAQRAALGDHFGLWQQFEVEQLPRTPRHQARPAGSTPTATSSSARRWTSTTSPGREATSRGRCHAWPARA